MAITTGQVITAADVNALRQYVELSDATSHQVGTGNTWEDWDISGIVPAGTTEVIVEIFRAANGELNGARDNGSAIDHRFNLVGGANERFLMECGLDASRVIEVYDDDAAKAGRFAIVGYRL